MAITPKEELWDLACRRVYEEKTFIAIGGKPVQIRLRNLLEPERTEYELELQDKKGKFDVKRARRNLIAWCMVDANGDRISYTDEDFIGWDGGLAGKVYEAARKLCGYEQGEIEDLVKNSEEAAG